MTFKGRTTTGRARLETGALQLRGGEVRLSIFVIPVSQRG
jgi:hypothetical protein